MIKLFLNNIITTFRLKTYQLGLVKYGLRPDFSKLRPKLILLITSLDFLKARPNLDRSYLSFFFKYKIILKKIIIRYI